MTLACDALQGQVESLTTESTSLKAEVARLQSQLLLNGIENE
jgi:cell division protein FtsB